MMRLNRHNGEVEHSQVSQLPGFLQAGDALVLNNTRVIPARSFAVKQGSGGKVECLFVEPVDESPDEWLVMMKSSHRPKPGQLLELSGVLELKVLENRQDGLNRVEVISDRPLLECLEEIGRLPLPPYIQREQPETPEDRERYQTIYAKEVGAVAAPTAGLHFTPELLDQIRARGVEVLELTLHVGPGTFRPVKSEVVEEHQMDAERYEVLAPVAEALNRSRAAGGRIVAVGSTSVRTLETIVDEEGRFQAGQGRSDLYIYPPYRFRAVDAILTNFHLPRSTLLMMMSAFCQREWLLEAYEAAVQERYRFFSYGDCMFLS